MPFATVGTYKMLHPAARNNLSSRIAFPLQQQVVFQSV
jgi:hypothetical protein